MREFFRIFMAVFLLFQSFYVNVVFASGCGDVFYLNSDPSHSDPVDPDPLPTDPNDDNRVDGPDGNVKYCSVSIAGADRWHHTLVIQPGQKVDIEGGLNNKGDERINNCEVKYYRTAKDEKRFDRFPSRYYGDDDNVDIQPGELIYKHWRNAEFPDTPGVYYVYIYVSYKDDVNPGNNLSRDDDVEEYAKVVVITPNLYTSSLFFKDGKTKFLPKEKANLNAFVNNGGPGDSPVDTTVTYYLDGVLFATDNIRDYNLEEGAVKLEEVEMVIPEANGNHAVMACADGYNYVRESNEGDNCRSLTFVVDDLHRETELLGNYLLMWK